MIKEIMVWLSKKSYNHAKENNKITEGEHDFHDCRGQGCQGCAEWFEQNPKEE